MKRSLIGLFTLLPLATLAQPAQRIQDFNAVGWYTYEGDHKLGSHFELHTEYQARRNNIITDWQQSLLRAGLAYKVMPRLKVSGGYTYLVTHPYGTHPRADAGKYPEQRFYEDVQLSDQVGYVLLDHRLRFEQRYVGIPNASGPLNNEAVWNRQNRIRYQLQLRVPLQGPTLDDGEFYAVGFDEVFLGFGRYVHLNVFDQNRVAVGLGYRVSDDCHFELQYLNQIVQHDDLDVSSKLPVFEFNNGFRLGLIYNLTLIAPKAEPGAGDLQE